jgi:spermidine synthase
MRSLPEYIKQMDNGDLWLTEDERENLKISYRIKEVIHAEQSPFQHVMILDSYDFGRMLVLDGVVQTTSIDGYIYNEMIAHVPMQMHPDPKKVLIIGGGDCGVAREVCKYPSVEQVDMVEIDELVVRVCKEHLPAVSGNLFDPRVNFIFTDGVQFVKERRGEYDLIIVDSSDPIGPAQVLFELEFYHDIHQALKEDGLMVCQSQSPIFHSDVMKQTYQRVGEFFPRVELYTAIVPTYPGGMWSFTMGSKVQYTLRNALPADTQYVNEQLLQRCFSLPNFVQTLISR